MAELSMHGDIQYLYLQNSIYIPSHMTVQKIVGQYTHFEKYILEIFTSSGHI